MKDNKLLDKIYEQFKISNGISNKFLENKNSSEFSYRIENERCKNLIINKLLKV